MDHGTMELNQEQTTDFFQNYPDPWIHGIGIRVAWQECLWKILCILHFQYIYGVYFGGVSSGRDIYCGV